MCSPARWVSRLSSRIADVLPIRNILRVITLLLLIRGLIVHVPVHSSAILRYLHRLPG